MALDLNHSEPFYTEADLPEPGVWLETLSDIRLRNWLRLCLWTRNSLPLLVPQNSRLAIDLAAIIQRGSPALRIRARAVIPGLLQEWGRNDSPDTLDDLLILCGRLRCAAAEPEISLLLSERLTNQAEVIALRQRCLSVLSGFGCTERTVSLFARYIDDIEYAAICYRALYRFDRRYAAIHLSDIISLFRKEGTTGERNIVIRTLARDLSSPNEFVELLIQYLTLSDSEQILNGLEVVRQVQILTAGLLLQAKSTQRIEVFRLILERCDPKSFHDLLWGLRSIGIDLLCNQYSNGEEYIEVLIEDRGTERMVTERIISTAELNDDTLGALVGMNEEIASHSISELDLTEG